MLSFFSSIDLMKWIFANNSNLLVFAFSATFKFEQSSGSRSHAPNGDGDGASVLKMLP